MRGFTLVELVVTMVVFSLMATTLVVFFRPTVMAFSDARERAALVDELDRAMRRITREVQQAVPNSIRAPSSDCFELVPSSTGGRARMAPDVTDPQSAAIETSQATSAFDVLTPMAVPPNEGDWVVVDNQNPDDVYSGTNRTQIKGVSVPDPALGQHRLDLATWQFPMGFDSGRFLVVPERQMAVFYVCEGADGKLDANGNGRGRLYRLAGYGFNAKAPGSCPSGKGNPVLAAQVTSCRFVYDPNQGATQQNGFVSIQLELARNGETASLVMGAHVANVP